MLINIWLEIESEKGEISWFLNIIKSISKLFILWMVDYKAEPLDMN